jgi:hypothetical protein
MVLNNPVLAPIHPLNHHHLILLLDPNKIEVEIQPSKQIIIAFVEALKIISQIHLSIGLNLFHHHILQIVWICA